MVEKVQWSVWKGSSVTTPENAHAVMMVVWFDQMTKKKSKKKDLQAPGSINRQKSRIVNDIEKSKHSGNEGSKAGRRVIDTHHFHPL